MMLAAGSTVLNRMITRKQNMWTVITAPYQYSVYASGALQKAINTMLANDSAYPTQRKAARELLANGPTIPYIGFQFYSEALVAKRPDGIKIDNVWFFSNPYR